MSKYEANFSYNPLNGIVEGEADESIKIEINSGSYRHATLEAEDYRRELINIHGQASDVKLVSLREID